MFFYSRYNNFGVSNLGPQIYQGQPSTAVDSADMAAGAQTPPQFCTTEECPSRAPASSAPLMASDGNARVASSLPDFGNAALN